MVTAAITPLAERQMFAVLWQQDYFETFGQQIPNADRETLLVEMSKSQVYDKYKEDFINQNRHDDILSSVVFLSLWRYVLPECRLRPWCCIPGTCHFCGHLNRLRQSTSDREVHKRLKEAHLLHRGGFFQKLRLKYKERVNKKFESAESRKKICSVIIDIMDQNKCHVPSLGTRDKFTEPIQQIITGAKEHGEMIWLFRSFNTVGKGSDLTIYCILTIIEKFKDRYGNFPEELYIQLDGGGENLNQYLIPMMELLVVLRVCRKILITRLPPGHTHEDIDAVFGVIWKTWYRTSICTTLDEYKEGVEKAFQAEGGIRATVIDVYTCPDYKWFLGDCYDPYIAQCFKTDKAQLQWCFEAIPVDPLYFPLGCKVTWRHYDADDVIEFDIVDKNFALTEIGKTTGFEPRKYYILWMPSKLISDGRYPDRNVEGYHFLRRMPMYDASLNMLNREPYNIFFWKPLDYQEGVVVDIHKTLRMVNVKFNLATDTNTRMWWREWGEKYAPLMINENGAEREQTTTEYVTLLSTQRSIHYHIPLKMILTSKSSLIPNWTYMQTAQTVNDPNQMILPIISLALNPVENEMNRTGGPARFIMTTDIQHRHLLTRYRLDRMQFYSTRNQQAPLMSLTNEQLKSLLRRKVLKDGIIPTMPTGIVLLLYFVHYTPVTINSYIICFIYL